MGVNHLKMGVNHLLKHTISLKMLSHNPKTIACPQARFKQKNYLQPPYERQY